MLYLIRTKGCKRCGGDLSLECDIYGTYVQCIQCGASWNENEITDPRLKYKTSAQPPAKSAAPVATVRR